jgi:hypothetical protein
MTRVRGHTIHPSIEASASDLKVADVGAGTGYATSPYMETGVQSLIWVSIWASELSNELPSSAAIYAFDESADNFPPESWRPPNVHFVKLDCFKSIPDQYRGEFDVVNMSFRLWIADDDGHAEAMLANVLTLLSMSFSWCVSLLKSVANKKQSPGVISNGSRHSRSPLAL